LRRPRRGRRLGQRRVLGVLLGVLLLGMLLLGVLLLGVLLSEELLLRMLLSGELLWCVLLLGRQDPRRLEAARVLRIVLRKTSSAIMPLFPQRRSLGMRGSCD